MHGTASGQLRDSVQAEILRNMAGHIVAGTAMDIERKELNSMPDAPGN